MVDIQNNTDTQELAHWHGRMHPQLHMDFGCMALLRYG